MATKRCPDCDTIKSVTNFGLNTSRADSLAVYCKTCANRRASEAYERKRIKQLGLVDLGDHECPGCHIVKPAGEFYYTLSDANGVYEFCKRCCPTPDGKLDKCGHDKKIIIDGNTLHVQLTKGQTMDCDNSPEAWTLLRKHNWYATKTGDRFYAVCHGASEDPSFHRLIMNCHDDHIVDHWDRYTLNNKVSNLRIGDSTLNNRNASVFSNNTSGIKGVRISSNCDSWMAYIGSGNDQRLKYFNIRKNGDTQAKDMAIQQRLAWETELGYTHTYVEDKNEID